MAIRQDKILIGIIFALFGVVLLVTAAIVFLMIQAKKRQRESNQSIKNKKPSLKLNIKKCELPLLVEEAPSQAYQILSDRQTTELQHVGFPWDAAAQVPQTPETPGFIPQTPGLIVEEVNTDSMPSSYKRSLSVPVESYLRTRTQGDVSPTLLWKNAIQVATRFDLSPRELKRISYCPHGKVKFSLIYNAHLQELHVRVLDVIDLPLVKETGLSFPFIKVFFLHEDKKASDFVEVLSYPKETSCTFSTVSLIVVRKSLLRFVVLEYDKFSRTEFMAEATTSLDQADLHGVVESKNLVVHTESEDNQAGLLLISLCYQPNNCRMSMVIMKAVDLPATEGHNHPDYFVKITLLRKNKVMDKRRTKVAKKSVCPRFNDRFSFPCEEAALKNITFVFDIVRYESRLRQEKNPIIGNVVIGDHYTGRDIGPLEIHHFREMLNSPQKQVGEWHRIIPRQSPGEK